ncbi:hypothetical protein SARC_15402, partial [Sphaeroforma arctica JP610]
MHAYSTICNYPTLPFLVPIQFEGHPPVPANVFPQNLIRGLTDKLYEKRKISAIEVQ